MTEKRYWKNSEPYHLVEVILEGNSVIFKDWFDTGKDPNRYDWSWDEFLTGKGKSDIEYYLGISAYQEILEEVRSRLEKE
ncbi:hypothetical protein EHQ68_09155 [Leptospira congkakensis]|uniref:Uncharacterized protein n=1 Tax=Leptospira congkakensis TaxID=2484932 RepID=A0A4Z1AEH7_9LEPT|nr:hypothetical protein [Leptospira congkakensis]TGL88793.1 hypothetical protein EHQ69_15225 [Leptospira congkakensis]TGL89379.1 hypothetical protein EHQ68_09155 [Leptospira congkakensis]TGL97347.1 hypothetical protein EHQ70_08650 [Leptospira congkakensis]